MKKKKDAAKAEAAAPQGDIAGLPAVMAPLERPPLMAPGKEYKLNWDNVQKHSFILFVLLGFAFNLNAINYEKANGIKYTDQDPAVSNLMLVLMLAVGMCCKEYTNQVTYGVYSLFSAMIVLLQGMEMLKGRKLYAADPNYDDTVWRWGFVIALLGSSICGWGAQTAYKAESRKFTQGFIITTAVLVGIAAALLGAAGFKASRTCEDAAFFTPPASAARSTMQRQSRYVKMDDGTRIAVDTYLPTDYNAVAGGAASSSSSSASSSTISAPMPTVIHMTRYNRNFAINKPFLNFRLSRSHTGGAKQFDLRTSAIAQELVDANIAFVSVDLRGTGASFGTRTVDLHPRQIKDSKQILEWVNEQKWSNGKVGALGIGADGAAAANLAARGGVEALSLMFAQTDVFTGRTFPGGISAGPQNSAHAQLVEALETGKSIGETVAGLAGAVSFSTFQFFSRVVSGAAPVEGWEHDLADAEALHAGNQFDTTGGVKLQTKSAVLLQGKGKQGLTYADISINSLIVDGLKKHNVQVYSTTGFYAGNTVSGLEQLHAELGDSSKLTIGPWSSSGGTCASTDGEIPAVSQFPLAHDARRFFACHLQGKCDGFAEESRVHYYAGEEKRWQAAASWPPQGLDAKVFYPAAGNVLGERPESDATTVEYTVDNTGGTTTGVSSRWNGALSVLGVSATYTPRTAGGSSGGGSDGARLSYTGSKLMQEVSMAGSASVTVQLELVGGVDAAVFAYIEDVAPDGTVSYVTEGQVRAAHSVTTRRKNADVGEYNAAGRSFLDGDVKELEGSIAVEIQLEPIAHTFERGHSIRLALAGSDSDNFDTASGYALIWKLHHDGTELTLPILASAPAST